MCVVLTIRAIFCPIKELIEATESKDQRALIRAHNLTENEQEKVDCTKEDCQCGNSSISTRTRPKQAYTVVRVNF
jgi:hypothetical protein